jgi:hypothetical protein
MAAPAPTTLAPAPVRSADRLLIRLVMNVMLSDTGTSTAEGSSHWFSAGPPRTPLGDEFAAARMSEIDERYIEEHPSHRSGHRLGTVGPIGSAKRRAPCDYRPHLSGSHPGKRHTSPPLAAVQISVF